MLHDQLHVGCSGHAVVVLDQLAQLLAHFGGDPLEHWHFHQAPAVGFLDVLLVSIDNAVIARQHGDGAPGHGGLELTLLVEGGLVRAVGGHIDQVTQVVVLHGRDFVDQGGHVP